MKLNRNTKKIKTASFGNIQSKSRVEKFFSNQKVIAFLALAFLIFLSFPLAKSQSRRLVADKEIKEMRLKIAEFEKENEELMELVDYISSPQAAENQGRMSLNLKKPGEAVIIIDRAEAQDLETESSEKKDESNSWKLWWSYFFK